MIGLPSPAIAKELVTKNKAIKNKLVTLSLYIMRCPVGFFSEFIMHVMQRAWNSLMSSDIMQRRVKIVGTKLRLNTDNLRFEAKAIHKQADQREHGIFGTRRGSSCRTVIASGSRRLVILATEGALRGCRLPFHACAHARERPIGQNFRKREKSTIRTPLQGRTV